MSTQPEFFLNTFAELDTITGVYTGLFPQASPGIVGIAEDGARQMQDGTLTAEQITRREMQPDGHDTRAMVAIAVGFHGLQANIENEHPVRRAMVKPTQLSTALITAAFRQSAIEFHRGEKGVRRKYLTLPTEADHQKFIAFGEDAEALEGYRRTMAAAANILFLPGGTALDEARIFRRDLLHLEAEFAGIRPPDPRHATHMERRAGLQERIAKAVHPLAVKGVLNARPEGVTERQVKASLGTLLLARPSRKLVDHYMQPESHS